MAENISKIISVINPDKYYDSKTKKELAEFKKLALQDFNAALKKAKAKPTEKHVLTYDSSSETLEPIYFWVLDFLNDRYDSVEKLVDSFSSSPGSGHFSELMGKATRMQEEGMKIMQTVGVLIKSLVNIVYDLRQFELRFKDYDAARSKDEDKAKAGIIALKQIWLDSVDIKRGNTSVKAMTFSQAAFVTLIDAFLIAENSKDVEKMDLNERVKRILIQRIHEFNQWRDLSEKELRKRYEIERSWLKSQVNALQLYSRWAKPYLKAAEELSMNTGKNAALVKAFNTIHMQLTILAKSKINIEEEAFSRNIPEDFKNLKIKRDYFACVLVNFEFRGIPQKAGQHYVFGGRADVTFQGYCLNEDEVLMLEERLKETDISDALRLVEGATEESLNQLKEDIEYFLKDESERQLEIEEKKISEDINPFAALFGLGKKSVKKPKPTGALNSGSPEKQKIQQMKDNGIKPDNYQESVIRALGIQNSKERCFTTFDVYKKAHGMPSHPDPYA